MSNTNGGEFGHVLIGYDFDIELFEEEIPLNVCEPHYIPQRVAAFQNSSGYFYCTSYDKVIKQMCPPGTEVSLKIGGCVNKTTNKSVFPTGSRCAAQPCQNGGVCFDFSSADAYLCHCPLPYEGLHCHLLQNYCFDSSCGRHGTGPANRYRTGRFAGHRCSPGQLFRPAGFYRYLPVFFPFLGDTA
ncbi:unnamed protein product [Adineta steineri]|uniref:EGF-like domain-containing protein n=1 Tax=Adineta steineri TaxID=433720 RepID=A0A815L8M8_9BILA|nr:unnamed protein product [Adineta steineri]CAF4038789.1 unnamed protein product [Adineta steineri]